MQDQFSILKQYFGHDRFRPGQEELVSGLLQGKDVLGIMPTGAGKSLCYQVPALAMDGITLVISPLISLMKDQVAALLQAGVAGAYLNSALNDAQYAKALANFRLQKYKIVYVAPERLLTAEFLRSCQLLPISMVAIDEAHCVSQWGQDFRPSYLKIPEFLTQLPRRPIVGAFTATATQAVKQDILRLLSLQDPLCVTTGFDRPNLFFSVERPASKDNRLLELVRQRKDRSGIVYCSTRRAVEEVTEKLTNCGIPATRYHAGLAPEERRQNQNDFSFDRKPVMVATNAFGMGIDKSNVSFVIHYNMPKNLESYYQEAGRAGRDGEEAECILLYAPQDVQTNKFLISRGETNPDLSLQEQILVRKQEMERLKQMTFYSTTTDCLRNFILRYFDETAATPCGKCSNCQTQFEEVDITHSAKHIIQCILDAGERYGKGMIIDILRGKQNKRVLQSGLDCSPWFGTESALSEERLRTILEQLCQLSLLCVEDGDYPTLYVSEEGKQLLMQSRPLTMRLPKQRERKRLLDETEAVRMAGAADATLLRALKALRRELAELQGVPAFVIFTDITLLEMASQKPTTREAFLEISGVGDAKCERYGEAFMSLIAQHLN